MSSQSSPDSVDARDSDDAACSLHRHNPRSIFHAGENGAQMHRYHSIELAQINVRYRRKLRTNPCVIHQTIEPAKALHRVIDHRLDIGFDRDIGAYEARGVAQLLRELLAPVLPSASNYNRGAFMDKNLRRARANAACPARYYCNLRFECPHKNSLLSKAGHHNQASKAPSGLSSRNRSVKRIRGSHIAYPGSLHSFSDLPPPRL